MKTFSLVAARRIVGVSGLTRSLRCLHVSPFLARLATRVHPSVTSNMITQRYFTTAGNIQVVKIPRLGESIVDGTVVTINKNVGDFVNQDDIICVLETAKVSCDIRSPYSGRMEAVTVKVGDTIAVDAELAKVDTSAKVDAKPAVQPAAGAPAPASSASSPVQQESNHKHGWGLRRARTPEEAAVVQPGPYPNAVSAAKPISSASPAVSPKPVAQSTAAPLARGTRSERKVKMTRMRQTIADRLKKAQNTLALLTTFNEVDMHNFMKLRDKLKDEFHEKHKVKLGFMSAFVKASSAALQVYPDVNAGIEGDHIVYHDYVDISVAVSTPTGLVVPVLRNVENMSFADVERQIGIFGQKAKKKELAMEDMVGGTFTISNGGVFGSMMGTPIVNPPQSAILGMHAIVKRPIAIGNEVLIRPVMYIALTYDHRLVDGATAVSFLKRVKLCIEEPARLLLDI